MAYLFVWLAVDTTKYSYLFDDLGSFNVIIFYSEESLTENGNVWTLFSLVIPLETHKADRDWVLFKCETFYFN